MQSDVNFTTLCLSTQEKKQQKQLYFLLCHCPWPFDFDENEILLTRSGKQVFFLNPVNRHIAK